MPSVNTSGSLTTTGGEDTLATVTAAGVYQLVLDLSDMVDASTPDTVQVRVYGKARSTDSERLEEVWEFIGSQGKPLWRSPPVISPHSYKATITAVAGTVTIPWAIYEV